MVKVKFRKAHWRTIHGTRCNGGRTGRRLQRRRQ